jgi:PAS domain S-box-containing protein
MLDPDGYVVSWNLGAERFKGYAANEILGQHFSRFYTPEDRAADLPARALRLARTEGRFENEGWRVRKDGTRFWANVVIDPIFEDGELVGFAKVTRDLSERRQASQALAVAKEELFQAQKMEAIGRLTGGIAHDFNNLLMAISGSLELLRKRVPDDPRMTRLIDNAMQGTLRGTALTQRMLAFARRQPLQPRLVNVADLVRDMRELLARSLGPSIEIRTEFDAAAGNVLIDPHQLELALLSLAVNARDAMPGSGVLTLSTHMENVAAGGPLKPGAYQRLSIADNGIGMSSETLAQATEPFFTTKGVGKGTGLGLPMVRGLSEQSGGGLTIESHEGVGTTVSIWLPSQGAETPVTTAAPKEPDLTAAPSRLKVLVVDDDFLVAMNTTAMLEDLGHDVVEVHSGIRALESLEADAFDLMITDQAMPQMTGVQLIAAAREKRPELRVILATGYAELPAGADPDLPRLNKPFFLADLERIILRTQSQP